MGLVRKYRPHPTCPDYCAERLRGIVENQKRLGEVSEDFDIEVRIVPKFGWIPGKTHVAKCEHGREFLLVEKKRTGEGK